MFYKGEFYKEVMMSTNINLKEAEKTAYRLSTSQDGLYDVVQGLFIILLSFLTWMDANGLQTPWNVILIEGIGFLIYRGVLLGKKYLVVPRIGTVRHGKGRRKRLRGLFITMIVIFLITGSLVILTYLGTRGKSILDLNIGWDLGFYLVQTAVAFSIFGIFFLIGYFNDYPRIILYGALFGLGYFISTYLRDQFGTLFDWPMTAVGVLS